jgi:hypothetical protein
LLLLIGSSSFELSPFDCSTVSVSTHLILSLPQHVSRAALLKPGSAKKSKLRGSTVNLKQKTRESPMAKFSANCAIFSQVPDFGK